MAGRDVVYTVTDPGAPGKAVADDVMAIAEGIAGDAARDTPRRTGNLARGWRAVKDGDGATVQNSVPYAMYVEYGTKYMRGRAMLGRAVAAARSRLS